jgi:hypothetical protein
MLSAFRCGKQQSGARLLLDWRLDLIYARFSLAESFGAPFAGVPIGGIPDVVTADACCKMHDDAAEDRSFHRRSCKREWSHPPTRACCIAGGARRIARVGGSGRMSREPACAPTPTTSSAGKQRQASTSFVRRRAPWRRGRSRVTSLSRIRSDNGLAAAHNQQNTTGGIAAHRSGSRQGPNRGSEAHAPEMIHT